MKKSNKNIGGNAHIGPRKNTGITLVALVVTIIVLLILAGVSINLIARQQWNFRTSPKDS